LDAPNSELVDVPPEVQQESESEHAIIHIDWRVSFSDGHEERFVADGDAAEVRQALIEFESHVRDR
jgi:hypothetical protein